MVIRVKTGSKLYYIESKAARKQPRITPFRSKAMTFSDLGQCKNIRDDILEYFPTAVIC